MVPVSEAPKPTSESLGNDSEDVRKEQEEGSEKQTEFPKMKERRSDHITTVRTAAKTLEAAGYPITERTIINWCRPAKDGSAKLDCAFDDTEKKYFITRESLEQAMVDMRKANPPQPLPNFSEVPKEPDTNSEGAPKVSEKEGSDSENGSGKINGSEDPQTELRRLRRQAIDDANKIEAKDTMIDEFQKGIEKLVDSFTERLSAQSESVGELKAEVKQLKGLLGSGNQDETIQGQRPTDETESN